MFTFAPKSPYLSEDILEFFLFPWKFPAILPVSVSNTGHELYEIMNILHVNGCLFLLRKAFAQHTS